jgi:hypothetical protein
MYLANAMIFGLERKKNQLLDSEDDENIITPVFFTTARHFLVYFLGFV